MNSVIFRTASMFLLPLLLLFSVVALLRGHNEPGGGFVGGLIAAAAFAIYAIAYGPAAARRLIRIDLRVLIGVGLGLGLASGLYALTRGEALFTGIWGDVPAGELGKLAIGTPVAFDIGVYLTVIGVVLLMIFELQET